MEIYYNYIKALHIIFVITWFAGLFYLPRLYIYILEAYNKTALEKDILTKQLLIMARRLWHIITFPSAILATIFGVWLLFINSEWLKLGWMHTKLLFVIFLWIYHFRTYKIFKSLKKETYKKSSIYMRFWNEIATVLLIAIVFLVVLKNQVGWIFGVIGILGTALLLTVFIKLKNKKKPN